MRTIAFHSKAFEDFASISKSNPKLYDKITTLIRETLRSPFAGIGKPEPLKHKLKGYWSRRITDEHRLVYTVTDDQIIIISCQYHY